ncbi:MAG: hypothetical protein ABTQ73_07120 [Caldilineales bacterium]
MKTTLALFEQRSQAEAAAVTLVQNGVAEHRVTLMDRNTPAAKLVEPGPRAITMKAVNGFTVMMVLIFALFGVAAAIASQFIYAADQGTMTLTMVVFLLIGAFCGLFMGWVKGRSDADNAIQEFREAVQHGDTLLMVADDRQIAAVQRILRSHSAHWLTTTAQINRMPVAPSLHALELTPAH